MHSDVLDELGQLRLPEVVHELVREGKEDRLELLQALVGAPRLVDLGDQNLLPVGHVPGAARLDKDLKQRVEHAVQHGDRVHQPVLCGVSDDGVLVVQEVQHHEEPHLVQLLKIARGVAVVGGRQLPEHGEPPDRGLLLLRLELARHHLGEEVRERFRQVHDHLGDAVVEEREVQQSPKFLQREFGVVQPLVELGLGQSRLGLQDDERLQIAVNGVLFI